MTIRPLQSTDRAPVAALCAGTPEHDVFLLANLDKLGQEQDLVHYWGQFTGDGRLIAVLMHYHVLWYLHDEPGADLPALAGVVQAQGQPEITVNDRTTVDRLAGLLTEYTVARRLPARLRCLQPGALRQAPRPGEVRPATPTDVDALVAFYTTAPSDVRRGRDSMRRSIGGGRRTFLLEQAGTIAAAALTTAELPGLAMMGGLHATSPERLSPTLAALAAALHADGMNACVVTRDPWIDEVCDRLGFETLGPWLILELTRKAGPAEEHPGDAANQASAWGLDAV